MSTGAWHVPEEQLERYLLGAIDPAQALSLEAHLDRCGRCRSALVADDAWLSQSWGQVAQLVVVPPRSLMDRALQSCGVPEHLARLLAATPTLSRAWLSAVGIVLAFAVAAAHAVPEAASGLLWFLLIAPVLPLAGIALAYGPQVDPAHELLAATPAAGARLLLLRAGVVLATALVPSALATSLLPGLSWWGAAWLLPALALTGACLLLSTRMPMLLAVGGLLVIWVTAVVLGGVLTGDRMLAFNAVAQLIYAGTAVVLAVVIAARRRHFDPREPRWASPSAFVR